MISPCFDIVSSENAELKVASPHQLRYSIHSQPRLIDKEAVINNLLCVPWNLKR